MAEFKITETRTVVQERTSIVEALNEDFIWIHDEFRVITETSDWETIDSIEEVTAVEAWT